MADHTRLTHEEAERALVRSMVKAMLIFVPAMVVFFVTLVAVAVGGGNPELFVWLGMAAGIGVYAGVFFGTWAGFVATAPVLDEVDLRADCSRPIPAQVESRSGH